MPRRLASRSALALLAALVLAASCRAGEADDDAGPTAEPRRPEPEAEDDRPVKIRYPAAPASFVKLTREVGDAVVNVRTTAKVSGGPASVYPTGTDDTSLGAGVLIDTEGLVLTNDHLITNGGDLRVVLADGTELTARVLGRDPKLDVALLDIEAQPRMSAARLGSSDQLQVGEWVVALGNPFGTEVIASACIVSSLGRSRESLVGDTGAAYRRFLHTDCVINAANSGGPLINTAGEVVGINSAAEKHASGFGYAVPVDRVKDILPMLEEEGRVVRAWLGVLIQPVTEAIADRYRLESPGGALVTEVQPGSPARKAGIESGDVILRFDGKDVDHRNLPWMVSTAGIGNQVPVSVWRNGQERELTVHTERMPE